MTRNYVVRNVTHGRMHRIIFESTRFKTASMFNYEQIFFRSQIGDDSLQTIEIFLCIKYEMIAT